MGSTASKNEDYYNYASMKLLNTGKCENENNEYNNYLKETDVQYIVNEAREIKNSNYKESLELYLKALHILKKTKENNSKVYNNVIEFDIKPQQFVRNNKIGSSYMDNNNTSVETVSTDCYSTENVSTVENINMIKNNAYKKDNKEKQNNNNSLDYNVSNDNSRISINKQIASLYNEIGDLCCIHDYIEKALFYYDKACIYSPLTVDYTYKKGVLYQQMNQIDKAIATFKIILGHNVNHIPTLFSIGNLYRYIDNNIALSYFETILKLEPENTEVLSLIASCYVNLGKINEAISYQNKAVQINPYNFNHKKFAQRLIENKSYN
ncbi:tetratricopeptide repeat protein, putative [Hepatocystis sp. ex Piliocolobus tephrosceles]|nr:tetratricopeptide repeat protein, putative [Hepatocystis sp. ex Piliocolobus tephrosceles]